MNHETLAIALNDADPEVRQSAILEVAENPQITLPEPSLDALISCLGANRKVIQRRAAEALAASAVHDARVVEKLRAMLSHRDPRARWGAAYALGLVSLADALDLSALPVLLDTLASNDGDVRWAAAELIVRLGRKNPAAVSKLLIDLAEHGNLNARKMALYCLRDVGGPRDELLAVAENCCGDHHTLLKMAALSLLARIHDDERSRGRVGDSLAPRRSRWWSATMRGGRARPYRKSFPFRNRRAKACRERARRHLYEARGGKSAHSPGS